MKKSMNRAIGIDYGFSRIGLSISDCSKIIASPLITIHAVKSSDQTAKNIITEIQKHPDVDEIIVGMPLHMNGKVGSKADEVNHFIKQLKKLISIPIIPWDERLTTVQAERSMQQGGLSRKKRKKVVDVIASVIILQSYLDSRSFCQEQT